MSQIFLVRHGETFAKTSQNDLGVPFVCGSGSEISRNTHLTENGKKQMFDVGQKYNSIDFDVVIVSDLVRSLESAVAFLKGAGQENLMLEAVEDKRLTEIDYGNDDGVSEETVKKRKKSFFSDNTKTALDYDVLRGGETFEQAGERMSETVKDITKKFMGKKILIISHSGSMRALIGGVIPGQDLKYGEVVSLKSDGKKIEIL